MPVNAPPRNALASRQARPLNGKEVANAIENHLLTLSTKLIDGAGILSDEMARLQEWLGDAFRESLKFQTRLQKVHITYPKVGWSIKLRLQRVEEEEQDLTHLSADIEVDLERNLRLNLTVGTSKGIVISSIEEEKIPSNIPDKDRQTFKLPVTAEFLKPDGTVGKVDLNELRSERRAARTVDVGSGAEGRQTRLVPSYDELGKPTVEEVKVAGGQLGQKVVLPGQLPEISLDDLVASPPPVEKAPPSVPLPPPNSMTKVHRPNVKFKK